MPKTTFVRKPYNLADIERGTEEIRTMRRQEGQPENQEDYYIAEEIEISGAEWCSLIACLPKDRDWLKAFSEKEYPNDGGGVPCLRVTSECSENALLIDTQGYSYARYVAIEAAAPASSQIEKPAIKLNEATSMDPRLVTEIQERLDEMVSPDWTQPNKHWINGALCAYSAWTGEQWELKKVPNKRLEKLGAFYEPICYVENEDGTERIIPSFLSF